ncbi:MAG TPA: TetR/AcrR family transcriptional regulator [Candidatus Mediterraneibacter quadrami]|uniref:TetR/AcrR family transcriptional regulator n=1 Tax=Candidatus Mediterraneibacter quadrami TaxID=2838684 RepID=A0A9D2RDW1_9FIRM|nr:TetR/AcrR family transcriptional regulator [Candidatus Mediterraneibacter quadrami]
MEDKRIAKTKKNLKNAMITMLGEKDFEHITITELCRAAEISRITFYSHYSDKYALLDEIFDDMLKLGTEDYYRRQRENNPTGRLAAGYVNMLDAILQLYSDRFDFFRHTDPEKNPYLASRLYSIVLETVEQHTLHVKKRMRLKYSPRKIAGFVCFGMFGFVNESREENTPMNELLPQARVLLTDLIRSGILTEDEH